MRVIDLDEAIERFLQAGNMSKDQIIYMLNRIPTTEIVRCKDCKFSESVITSWSTDGKNNVVERLCKVHKWSVKDDDFCSYGERRDNERYNIDAE